MIQLQPFRYPSSAVQGAAFAGESRGDIHIQFLAKDGTLADYGVYYDVPRALFSGLLIDRSPGAFITKNLKPHFEYQKLTGKGNIAIDETLPDMIVIPADCPNEIKAIDACINSQRLTAQPSLL